LIAVLIPKCPLCAIAILSFFEISGLGLKADSLSPLTFIFILLGLGALTLRANHKRNYKPLFLGLIASTIILTEKFLISSAVAFYVGPTLFIIAVLWNGFSDDLKTKNGSDCQCSYRYKFRRTKCPK
jgi:hypothetical protein